LKRRRFSALAAVATLGLHRAATAQGPTPVTASDYTKMPVPLPVSAPAGSVEVVEFFSYACPHCFDFEPHLEAWLKRKAPEIRFRRSPVPFMQNFRIFQPMYFALESMGIADAMQQKVFDAVHKEHQRLDKPDDIIAFMTRNGVDAQKFMTAFGAFGTGVKVTQASTLFQNSGANGVPTLMVQGRFLTSPLIARGEAKALATVDWLVAEVRAGR
jgi:thiol:disulfide interchange protein DsbA